MKINQRLLKKVFIYLVGVVMGIMLIRLFPDKEPREPHPWHEQTAPDGTYPLTVTDDYGRSVVLKTQPRWIVSLAPSITETLFAMEMGDHISAVTRWDDYPEQARTLRESGFSVGDIDAPDIERIHTLPVDLVLGSQLTSQQIYEKIAGVRGLPTLAVDAVDLDDFLEADLPLLGNVLGVPGKALRLRLQIQARRDAVAERLDAVRSQPARRTVLLLGIEETLIPGWSAGAETWLGDLIEEAHGQNLSADLGKQWGVFPLESLLAADPEAILIRDGSTPEEAEALRERLAALPEHPIWKHLSAVQNNRIGILPYGPLTIPGPRMIDALEAIAGGIWPELVKAIPENSGTAEDKADGSEE